MLDTNALIDLWHGRVGGAGRVHSEKSADESAKGWLARHPADAIVTPVRLEFLGGTRNRDELRWAEAFLGWFDLIDDGRVLDADWQLEERFAKRVPHKGRRRGALDCLAAAICLRLRADFETNDTGVPANPAPP